MTDSEIQVEPEHYDWLSYNVRGRWLSYWHQVDEVLRLRATSCLEIGKGTGLVGEQISRAGIPVTTVDFDARLGADRVGDVRSLPCSDAEFDVVLCSQVLEHLPWAELPIALEEIYRVSSRAAVISLPQSGLSISGSVGVHEFTRSFGTKVQTPHAGRLPDEHYWQVGRRGTHRRDVRRRMQRAGFTVSCEYSVPEFTFHRFYILTKGS